MDGLGFLREVLKRAKTFMKSEILSESMRGLMEKAVGQEVFIS